MGFFGKINPFNLHHGLVHTVAKNPFLSKALPIALTLAGQPELAAAAVAAESYSTGGKPIPSLLKGATSYAGNAIGSSIGNSLFPQSIGATVGGGTAGAANAVGPFTLGSTVGNALGSGFAGNIANSIANTSIGSALGGAAGNALASNLTAPKPKEDAQTALNPNSLLPAPFSPKQSPQLQLPGSLSNLSGMDNTQQTSNLATQGVYGGGLGPQEQQYFTGLVNNQLVDKSGKTQDISSLSPIENSYLSQLGFGGYRNSKDLLGAISKWKQGQQATV